MIPTNLLTTLAFFLIAVNCCYVFIIPQIHFKNFDFPSSLVPSILPYKLGVIFMGMKKKNPNPKKNPKCPTQKY